MTKMSWDTYFLNIAEVVATRSDVPTTRTGAVIVDEKHRPVSFGYNGDIAGSDNRFMTHEKPVFYYTTVHAEMNALSFANRNLENCTMYTLFAPCENCLKHTLQAGIKRIVYRKVYGYKKNASKDFQQDYAKEAITRLLLSMPHVECIHENGDRTYLEDLWDGKENIPTVEDFRHNQKESRTFYDDKKAEV